VTNTADALTDRNFWARYWSDYRPIPIVNVWFERLLSRFPTAPGTTFIELGGFPGRFATYFKICFDYQVSLLDYYIDRKIVNGVEEVNGLPPGSIELIESDLFSFRTDRTYDVVFSSGLIEHFKDTASVLDAHYKLLNERGLLFVTLPNFRGLNGLLQKLLHPTNFKRHNIGCMDPAKLKSICAQFEFGHCETFYYGKPTFWLDGGARGGAAMRSIVTHLSSSLSHLPLQPQNWLFSPYIIILAKK